MLPENREVALNLTISKSNFKVENTLQTINGFRRMICCMSNQIIFQFFKPNPIKVTSKLTIQLQGAGEQFNEGQEQVHDEGG